MWSLVEDHGLARRSILTGVARSSSSSFLIFDVVDLMMVVVVVWRVIPRSLGSGPKWASQSPRDITAWPPPYGRDYYPGPIDSLSWFAKA